MNLYIFAILALILCIHSFCQGSNDLLPPFSFSNYKSLSELPDNDTYFVEPIQQCIQDGMIALTFDHELDEKYTPKLLDLLRAKNIKATFYIRSACNYFDSEKEEDVNLLRRLIAENHTVGISMTARSTIANATEFVEALGMSTVGMYEATGVLPRFVRLPRNSIGEDVLYLIDSLGYIRVDANLYLSPLPHSSSNGGVLLEHLTQLNCARNKNGDLSSVIAIQNDDTEFDIDSLTELISVIQKRCQFYSFVDMDQCLRVSKDDVNPRFANSNIKKKKNVKSKSHDSNASLVRKSLIPSSIPDINEGSIAQTKDNKKYIVRLPDSIPDSVVGRVYNESKDYAQLSSVLKLKMSAMTKTKIDENILGQTAISTATILEDLSNSPMTSKSIEIFTSTSDGSLNTQTSVSSATSSMAESMPESLGATNTQAIMTVMEITIESSSSRHTYSSSYLETPTATTFQGTFTEAATITQNESGLQSEYPSLTPIMVMSTGISPLPSSDLINSSIEKESQMIITSSPCMDHTESLHVVTAKTINDETSSGTKTEYLSNTLTQTVDQASATITSIITASSYMNSISATSTEFRSILPIETNTESLSLSLSSVMSDSITTASLSKTESISKYYVSESESDTKVLSETIVTPTGSKTASSASETLSMTFYMNPYTLSATMSDLDNFSVSSATSVDTSSATNTISSSESEPNQSSATNSITFEIGTSTSPATNSLVLTPTLEPQATLSKRNIFISGEPGDTFKNNESVSEEVENNESFLLTSSKHSNQKSRRRNSNHHNARPILPVVRW